MATTAVTIQYANDANVDGNADSDLAFTNLNNTDTFTINNDGRTILWVRNTDGSSATITLTIPRNVRGLVVTNPTVSVDATTGEKVIGPFPTTTYNAPGGETMSFTCGTASGVSVAAIRI